MISESNRGVAMILSAARTIAQVLCVSLITGTLAHGGCSVDVVTVRVRAERAPRDAKVRVQLVYAQGQVEDSAEATVDSGAFNVPVEFLTQSRRPILIGNFREKCDRKPKTVVITLVWSDQEYDRVSFEFPKDFKMAMPGSYTLPSEVVLNGPR